MPLLPLTPILPLLPKLLDWVVLALDISVLVLWVMRLVADLAQAYLAEVSQRYALAASSRCALRLSC